MEKSLQTMIGNLSEKSNISILEKKRFACLRLLLTTILFFLFSKISFSQEFITEWAHNFSFTSLSFGAEATDSVNYTWYTVPSGNSGSGSFTQTPTGQITIYNLTVLNGDTLILAMEPENLSRFYIDGGQHRLRLKNIAQWGAVSWTTMKDAFTGCENLIITASDLPNLSNVTDMSNMFYNATSFNQDISGWDVSNVTNMNSLFYNCTSFNQPLNTWDVSNVTDMRRIFHNATSFNQPLNDWDMSNVTYANRMFYHAHSFNQPLNNWDVSNMVDQGEMFGSAYSFNQDISGWDMSNSIGVANMFEDAISFNQPLNDWDTSSMVDFSRVFKGAISFNQPLNNWNTSNVFDMKEMFKGATSFNQPLNDWDTSGVIDIHEMFKEATSFNQPLNNWDVSEAYIMWDLFYNASSFNQDISNWSFHQFSTQSISAFLSNSAMDVINYDRLLNTFATLGHTNRVLGAHGLEYCNQATRDYLVNVLGWEINGDSSSAECNFITGTILFDFNNDGCDLDDNIISGITINANDDTYDFSTISIDGTYNLGLFGTSFTVSLIGVPEYFTVSPVSAEVTFSGSNVEEVDFCLTANQVIEDLNITILPTNEARPGFESNYRLIVRNVGTETIANVAATLTFDDAMQEFVSTNPNPDSSTNNSLTFSLGNLQPFENKIIDITMQTFQPPLVEGGDILNFTAVVTPDTNDYTPDDNTYHLEQIVVNSFDPNDKQVLQGEELYIGDIHKYLDYLIRFQNTGTASAINVRILDTLHPKLDWSTLVPISASHDYYVHITNGNQVEFIFDDINLPHEGSNEPESHGFVVYKIKPKSDVQVGDIISGDAAIYFDFNPPIITDMVFTEIVEFLGLTDNTTLVNQVIIYPNPTNKKLNLYLAEGIQLEEIILYNLQGQKIQNFQGKEKTIDIEHLPSGMYLLKITTNQGTINHQLIKN